MIRQWPLVGRAEELAVIAEATEPAADRPRGIVLSGPAGVGKTRVALEAVDGCSRRGMRSHWIVGTTSARSVPLGAFADIASDFGPDPLRRVREVIDGVVGDVKHGDVVIGVDDAHLLDDLSAFTVHQLITRRLATVVLTIRSKEQTPDAITAIWKDDHLERLELQPLSPSEIGNLVGQVLGGPVDSFSAQRLWQYTQGNALYLRHLLDNEVRADRMTLRSGVWLWDGHPRLSSTLAELLEARIAHAPAAVRDVLDALAVAEPLESDILETIADSDALTQAESLGLISVDTSMRPTSVRLAHPLLCDVTHTGTVQMRRLRGRIATELARQDSVDPRQLVRRAALMIDSNLAPDIAVLLAAASAAMQLGDLRLAETLAGHAVSVGGGLEAKLIEAMAITWQERGTDSEAILAELAGETETPLRAQIAILRAMNFAASLGDAASAESELAEAVPADDEAAQAISGAVRAFIELVRGHSATAAERAAAILADPPASGMARMFLIWTVVSGLGDLGRIDEFDSTADAGYQLAETSPETSHLRLPLATFQVIAYWLAGALTKSDAIISEIRGDTIDVPFQQSWRSFFTAMSAIGHGDLAVAQLSLQETVAHLDSGGLGQMLKAFARSWLATVAGMAGNAIVARREFTALQWWDRDPDARKWDSAKSIAEAWVCAAEAATTTAISIIRDAAERERSLRRPAWEVMLLQTATQFGDRTTAARLAELANDVAGPRAAAAATHAAALAAEDGDGLLDASRHYEEFGDRLAAVDAAAQAVVIYQRSGLRGSAMKASANVERRAAQCQGVQTPAIRAAATPQLFTDRQNEIISLAAQGLSNKEIADRLTMSRRSVEGHLFRASRRVGANSREQLIAMLQGR